MGEGIVYTLVLDARWRELFKPELEAAEKAAEEIGGRLPVEDLFSYMVGWVASDVAITRRRNERVLRMSTSHLWQLAETHALFGWSVVGLRMSLTLEGPKLAVMVEAPLENLDDAIKKSAESGWLKMLGIKAESWEGLKQRVVENWDVVVDAAARRLGEEVRGELEALKNKLNDDKVAREVIAPALLLIQAERLGVNETTLRYLAAVASGAIDGDGYVSAAMGMVDLTSGKHAVALLWKAALAAHGIETEVRGTDRKLDVVASGGGAVRLAGLYFLYGSPLLEEDERIINHKLAEAMSRGSLTLKGLEKEIEVGGRRHMVKVIDGGAVKEKQNDKTLLRIKITAEVDGVRRDYEITYGRYGKNEARGRAYASAEAPGGREADAERFSALVKALTGKEPKVYRMKNGKIIIECYEGHLEGFMRYAELAEAIKKWLEETGRRAPSTGR